MCSPRGWFPFPELQGMIGPPAAFPRSFRIFHGFYTILTQPDRCRPSNHDPPFRRPRGELGERHDEGGNTPALALVTQYSKLRGDLKRSIQLLSLAHLGLAALPCSRSLTKPCILTGVYPCASVLFICRPDALKSTYSMVSKRLAAFVESTSWSFLTAAAYLICSRLPVDLPGSESFANHSNSDYLEGGRTGGHALVYLRS